MVNVKRQNKPGRVGVKRHRPTRYQSEQAAWKAGFTAGKRSVFSDEITFLTRLKGEIRNKKMHELVDARLKELNR